MYGTLDYEVHNKYSTRCIVKINTYYRTKFSKHYIFVQNVVMSKIAYAADDYKDHHHNIYNEREKYIRKKNIYVVKSLFVILLLLLFLLLHVK